MTTLMGLDYGDRRIGIAFSSSSLASAYETYVRKDEITDLNYLKRLIIENKVSKIIYGLPLNMDGTEGDRAIITREFAKKLYEITFVEYDFQDERLTSVEAEEILIEMGIKRDKRKLLIDKICARIILQTYIDKKK